MPAKLETHPLRDDKSRLCSMDSPITAPRLSAMRILSFALCTLALPATAWEFSPSPICTLTHRSEAGSLTVTYDASLPEYAIEITLAEADWPDSATFAMGFLGENPISIQTDRHVRSDDGRSLTVTDRGFGNVLNGLEFNTVAAGFAGEFSVSFDLTGIGPAITAFRNCPADNLT